MVTEDMFQSTGSLAISHHFLCKLCNAIVFDEGRECSNQRCQVLFCEGCAKGGSSIRCPTCGQQGRPNKLNKKVQNIMELLKIVCPGCGESFMQGQIIKHMAQCEDALKVAAEGRKFDSGVNADEKAAQQLEQQNARRQTVRAKFAQAQVDVLPVTVEFPHLVYVFQKDSKTVSTYNPMTKQVSHKFIEHRGNFPHNFQMIQVGIQVPRVFMIGGGDFKTLPESMFQCREVTQKYDSQKYNLQFIEKKRMRYARHGHSCCAIQDRYIVVSGSRKEVNGAAQKVEVYDTQLDEWMEIAKINEGRHYHSSCHFNHKFLFVFGGIANANKKYSANIERLVFDITNQSHNWEMLNVRPECAHLLSSISPRQGVGMTQLSGTELLIVGGFNSKFVTDYYTVSIDEETGRPTNVNKQEITSGAGSLTLFPFQVPTIGDASKREVITVDWQTMALYKYIGGNWKYMQHIKNSGN